MKNLNISLNSHQVRQKLFVWILLASTSVAMAQPSSVMIALSGQPLNGDDAPHPYANDSASVGANLVLNPTVTGTPPFSYQWVFNGASLLNQTNASLKLNSVQATNEGTYAVVISNAGGSVSNEIVLTIDTNFTKVTTGPMVTTVMPGAAAVTWADYDNDGLLDALISFGSDGQLRAPQLYHNLGGGSFTRVTLFPATDGDAACWGDYDNDGFVDLYLPSDSVKYLYHNNGNGTFTRADANEHISDDIEQTYCAAWGDYNNDGFIDMIAPTFDPSAKSHCFLYNNNGDGTFGTITNSPLVTFIGSGIGASWADYDNDGHLDLFVGGGRGPDSGIRVMNRLYHNNGDGTFMQMTNAGDISTDVGFNGTAIWGDYDNDGYFDVFLPNAGGFTPYLYHNNRDGTFSRVRDSIVEMDAVPNGGTGSCAWGDYDNDGFLDLFVSNEGPSSPVTVNFLYHNNGDGTFTRVTTGSIVNEYSDTAGCAWVDYDNDGFLDLIAVGEHGQGNYLYHNTGNTNGWLTVRLRGTVSNASAIGAKVRVKAHYRGVDRWQLRQIFSGSGWQGHDELQANFGLGDATNADIVRIEWPSGIVQEFQNVAAKQILTYTEPPRLLTTTTGGVPQFSLKGGRGFQYEVDSSPDLSAWASNSVVTVTNFNGIMPVVDNNPPTATRFYRLRQLVP
jgi:hypothetical protein